MKPSEYLKSKRWIKEQAVSYDSIGGVAGCCMVGAICYSIFDYKLKKEYFDTLYTLIDGYLVEYWNDSIAKDKEEVIKKLEEVETILGL